MKYIIYGLVDPFTGQLRYIGKSEEGMKRPLQHSMPSLLAKNTNPHKCNWVRSVLAKCGIVEILIIQEFQEAEILDQAEIHWISYFRGLGCNLLNISTGGEAGTKGWKQSPETIAKRVAHFKGVPKTQECKDKISATLTGQPSPKKGRPLSPEELISHAKSHAIPPFQDQHGRVYATLKEAAEMWNLEPGNICNVLKRKRKSTGGLVFTYIHELDSKAALDKQRLEDIEKSKQETKERDYARTKAWKEAHPDYMPAYLKEYKKD